MTTSLIYRFLGLLSAVSMLVACGDDDEDPIKCDDNMRLAVEVNVGGEHKVYRQADTLGGLISENGFGIVFNELTTETGATVQQIVHFGTNTPFEDGMDYLSAIRNAPNSTLTIGSEDICDPREGVACGVLGTDENRDATADFELELHQPAISGTVDVSSPDGNTFQGTFEMEVGDNIHSSAPFLIGDGTGGTVRGCFNMRLDAGQRELN